MAAGAGGDKSTRALFDARKQQALQHTDLSRKGSIDEYIRPLVECINANHDYMTTSSCSGRILIYCEGGQKKKGCQWLLVTHNPVTLDEVVASLSTELPMGDVNFKFEPFVLHVLCANLDAASDMHRLAIASGFRNSGIGISKKNKIVLAIRSTLVLEAPVASNGKLIVDHKYLSHLVSVANKKMSDNKSRIDRLYGVVRLPQANATAGAKSMVDIGDDELSKTNRTDLVCDNDSSECIYIPDNTCEH